jgi:hypothetical protein
MERPYQALRRWRGAVESRNVFVLQLSMPVDDARGCSLTDQEPFMIVVSSSDAVQARIFTLFHEYAHLRNPGICLAKADLRANGPSRRLNNGATGVPRLTLAQAGVSAAARFIRAF